MLAQSVFTSEWWRELLSPDSRWQDGSLLRITIGAILTLGLYSLLYRENKFYRFTEHIFVGLATGFSVVALVKEVLWPQWWVPMLGVPERTATADMPAVPGVDAAWLWGALLPLACLAFFVFSKKHGWLSRIPLGIIVTMQIGRHHRRPVGRATVERISEPLLASSCRPSPTHHPRSANGHPRCHQQPDRRYHMDRGAQLLRVLLRAEEQVPPAHVPDGKVAPYGRLRRYLRNDDDDTLRAVH